MDSFLFKSSRCILADQAPLEVGKTEKGNTLRKMQVLRTGTFTDPRYGKFPITPKMLSDMVKNFSEGVRGVIPSLDYKHESDDIAAGWFQKLYTVNDGDNVELWAEIELTPRGEKTLSDKEFGYISADFDSDYCDNETGVKHGCVLLGAGLTNRPVIKRMESVIELSEKPAKEMGGEGSGRTPNGAAAKAPAAMAAKAANGQIKLKTPKNKAEGLQLMKEVGAHFDHAKKEHEADPKNIDKGLRYRHATIQMGRAVNMAKKLAETNGRKNKMPELEKMSPEELIAMIKDLQAKLAAASAEEMPEGEMDMGDCAPTPKETKLSAQLAEANTKLAELEKAKAESEKTSQFVKMLSEGKAVEAQREAFMGGDMMKFAELAQPLNANASGSNTNESKFADAQEEVIETAKKLSEEKKISMKDAISEVLSNNKLLAEKVRK